MPSNWFISNELIFEHFHKDGFNKKMGKKFNKIDSFHEYFGLYFCLLLAHCVFGHQQNDKKRDIK